MNFYDIEPFVGMTVSQLINVGRKRIHVWFWINCLRQRLPFALYTNARIKWALNSY